jgi:RNA polymerase sigma-70 factor, ECF subfamily
VAQEAFVRAMSTLARFDTARPFAPWLTRIAVNAALDELRRERRLGPEEPTAAEAAPEPAVAVVRAVARLAPERRLIVALHYWLDYPTPEIAELLDLPLGTVASRLSRALAELRLDLEAKHV